MLEINIICNDLARHKSRGILRNGLSTFKSRAFVFPIFRYSAELRRRGIDCTIYTSVPEEVEDCNILLIQDKLVKQGTGVKLSIEALHRFQESVDSLVWLDTTDSTGTIHTDALSVVDRYYKKQLLENRRRYLKPMYGMRPYTHFYHKKFGVEDSDEGVDESHAEVPVESESHLDKLKLSWNIGVVPNIAYADPVWYLIDALPSTVRRNVPWSRVFDAQLLWKLPDTERPTDVSGRFSTSYDRETVEYHRQLMREKLKSRYEHGTVSAGKYWKEIRKAKVLLSPFGWGEVCHRDFEGFLSGNVLMKPSVEHLDTWPPLFEAGKTYVELSWDMEDATETLDAVLDQYEEYRDVAKAGQQRYREYLTGETAAERFVDHFETLVRGT